MFVESALAGLFGLRIWSEVWKLSQESLCFSSVVTSERIIETSNG